MASKAAAHFLQFRIQYSSIAFLYYDYALTFPAEVKYMWGKKLRFSTLLYICCRYALVANVLYALAKLEKLGTTHVSLGSNKVFRILNLTLVVTYAALTGRTYAVYGCNRFILAYFVVLGLACIALDFTHVPGLRCEGSSANRTGLFPAAHFTAKLMNTPFQVDTLLSIMMVVFEFTAAILLTVRSLMEFRVGGTWKFDNASFFTTVFKQGIMYFAVVSFFTTAAVVLNFRAPAGSFFQRLPNAFTLPLSCTLVARFLLQLREWQDKKIVMVGDGGQNLTTRDQHPETLTEIRANTMVESVILSDFGDGPSYSTSSARDGWEAGWGRSTLDGESANRLEKGSDEATRSETIALHEVHLETADGESRNEEKRR